MINPITVDIPVKDYSREYSISVVSNEQCFAVANDSEPIRVSMSVETISPEYSINLSGSLADITMQSAEQINVVSYTVPAYEGAYTVIPLEASSTVLGTKNKRCTDDITVEKIPRRQTSNEYGTTFYIAEV